MFLLNVTACPIRATSGRMGLSGLVSGGLSSRSIVVVCVQEQIIPSHLEGMGNRNREWNGQALSFQGLGLHNLPEQQHQRRTKVQACELGDISHSQHKEQGGDVDVHDP